ncbi:MAG: ABC transporter permease [Lachnospiraceae bacterium]|nr:ABC transporter permease [Lachnospiraceae bacterium]
MYGSEKFSLIGYVKYLSRYKFLIEQLVSRDFKTKYKRSVLGVFWSFLNPLLMMCVQYAVFSKLIMRGGGIEHYAMYLLTGIVIFNGFNDCCNQSMRAVVGNSSLITKVYVPKFIYPASKVCSASVNMLLAMIPLLIVAVINKLWPCLPWLLIPVGLAMMIIFTMGMGLLLSSLMVFFRDIEFLWGVMSMVWMYGTPIIYSMDLLPEILQKVEIFNPLYHYITFIRTLVIGRAWPDWQQYAWCLGFAAVMFAVGAFVFHKTEDKFIFYI